MAVNNEHENNLKVVIKENPELLSDWRWRIQNLYFIINKEGNKVLFKPNTAQMKLMEYVDLYDKFIILKSRQLGFSTFIAIFFLDKILFGSNKEAAIIAHTKELAADIFDVKGMYAVANMPEFIRNRINFKRTSARKLQVSKKNGAINTFNVLVSTRGKTVNYTHISELAKIAAMFPKKAIEILTGSMSSVARGNKLFIESTAEGASGLFYDTFTRSWKLRSQIENNALIAQSVPYPLFFNWRWDIEEIDRKTDGQIIPVADMVSSDMDFAKLQEDHNLTDKEVTFYYLKWLELNEDTAKLQQEYPTTPEEAFIASGQCFFNQRKLSDLSQKNEQPLYRATLVDNKLEEDPNGLFWVYEEPRAGHQYVLGADTGAGLQNGDASTITIINKLTKKPALFYAGQDEPSEFDTIVNDVGLVYNTALVAVESNMHGLYVNDQLVKKHMYPNMYQQVQYDNISREVTKKVGYDTTSKTRIKALETFRKEFNNSNHPLPPRLIDEMTTFVYNKKTRPEALSGKHDDMVMATAIAYSVIDTWHVEAKKEKTHSASCDRDWLDMFSFGEITIDQIPVDVQMRVFGGTSVTIPK